MCMCVCEYMCMCVCVYMYICVCVYAHSMLCLHGELGYEACICNFYIFERSSTLSLSVIMMFISLSLPLSLLPYNSYRSGRIEWLTSCDIIRAFFVQRPAGHPQKQQQ